MAATIKPITPHLKSLAAPAPLRGLQAWLIWRYEENPSGGKPRKVPYYANGGKRLGRHGAPTDVAQLVTFAAACKAAAARGFTGVGFATLEQFGITALDFDACVGEHGIHPDVEALVTGTYAEFSPSGTGVRAFLRGAFGANPKSHATAAQWGLEVFSTSGFVTFTGAVLELTELTGCENVVAPIPAAVRAEFARRFGRESGDDQRNADTPPLGLTHDQVAEVLQLLPNDARDYDKMLSVGMAVHHELGGDGFELWDAWCAKCGEYTTSSYYEARWDSFGRNDTGKIVTFRSVLKLARDAGLEVPHGQVAEASDFEVIPEPPRRRFRLLTVDQARAAFGQTRWLIRRLLPWANVGMLFGPSGSGKSALLVHMAACVALERPWFGVEPTNSGRVVIVSLEGQTDFIARLKAYQDHHGVSFGDRLLVMPDSFSLVKADAARALAEDIATAGGATLVVIDTLSRASRGVDENDNSAMGLVMSHAMELSQATGAMVLVVHHTGKDASRGPRGGSLLKADLDVEMSTEVDSHGRRFARVTKMKGGPGEGDVYSFSVEGVDVGVDPDDGLPISAAIALEGEADAAPAKLPTLGRNQKRVLATLADLEGFGNAVTQGALIEAVAARMDAPKPRADGAVRDRRRETALETVDRLITMRVLRMDGDIVTTEGRAL